MKKAAKFKRLKTSSYSYDHKSAELIGSNDDLLTEILFRLCDAKSLFRFKAVSKQWQSLLSTHPRLISPLLFDKSLKSSGLYYSKLHVSFDVQNPNATPSFRGIDFTPDDIDEIKIMQSCNGLLLCRGSKNDLYSSSRNYYVCNPTTKKVAAIPPVIGDRQDLIPLMGLAYHPTECVHYQLVCILLSGYSYRFSGERKTYKILLYSSRTGTWKGLTDFTPADKPDFQYGVYWNGGFHWAPSGRNSMYLRLDNEKLYNLPRPPVRIGSSFYQMPLYFGESRGHLHLVDAEDDQNPLRLINVYEMLRDHSGWVINYQLDLTELHAAYPNMASEYKRNDNAFRVLDVVRGGEEEYEEYEEEAEEEEEYEEYEEEDTFLVVKALNNIKRYNILDQSFTQLFSIPDDIEKRSRYKHVYAHRYIEKIGSF